VNKMSNCGSNQSGIFAKIGETLRALRGNKAIPIDALLTLIKAIPIVALLTLIATVANKEVRILVGLEEVQINQTPVSGTLSSDKNLKISYAPFEYTMHEHQPQFVKDAQASLSVVFQNIDGEDFVSLNISPTGKKSSVRAVLSGYTEEFKSSAGFFNVQVLNIDYDNKKVVVQVIRKSH